MKSRLLVLLCLLVISLGIALYYSNIDFQSILGQFNGQESQNISETPSVPAVETPEQKKDQEYRTTIATSFCNAQRKKRKVEIENYNQCIEGGIGFPLAIYKGFTGRQLSKSWEDLALNEKELVIQEIQEAEKKFYSSQAAAESQKALNDYLSCQNLMLKKSTLWLDQKCPNSGNPMADMMCRSEAGSSAEFKKIFFCKSPF